MIRLILLASLLLLAACASDPHAYDNVESAAIPSVVLDATPALDRRAIPGRHRPAPVRGPAARRAGDILTIRLVERTDASKKASHQHEEGQQHGLTDPAHRGSSGHHQRSPS
jgi:flagellar L-ring protein precursor FlgH